MFSSASCSTIPLICRMRTSCWKPTTERSPSPCTFDGVSTALLESSALNATRMSLKRLGGSSSRLKQKMSNNKSNYQKLKNNDSNNNQKISKPSTILNNNGNTIIRSPNMVTNAVRWISKPCSIEVIVVDQLSLLRCHDAKNKLNNNNNNNNNLSNYNNDDTMERKQVPTKGRVSPSPSLTTVPSSDSYSTCSSSSETLASLDGNSCNGDDDNETLITTTSNTTTTTTTTTTMVEEGLVVQPRGVSFADPIVTKSWEIPKLGKEDSKELFYNGYDIANFRRQHRTTYGDEGRYDRVFCEQLVEELDAMAREFFESGDLEQALEAFEHSLRVRMKTSIGFSAESNSNTLHCMGDVYAKQRDWEKAGGAYAMASRALMRAYSVDGDVGGKKKKKKKTWYDDDDDDDGDVEIQKTLVVLKRKRVAMEKRLSISRFKGSK